MRIVSQVNDGQDQLDTLTLRGWRPRSCLLPTYGQQHYLSRAHRPPIPGTSHRRHDRTNSAVLYLPELVVEPLRFFTPKVAETHTE